MDIDDEPVIRLDERVEETTTPEPLARAGRLLDRLPAWLARQEALDGASTAIARPVHKALPPGPVKDLLSGTWQGHALHPMLTDVTIGAWTSAMLLDLTGERGARSADTLVGLGILSAIPTAVTGLSDYVDIGAKPKRRIGLAHALGNSTALALYGLSYLARKRGARGTGIALSYAGAAVASLAGYLGGHLVYRDGVGVDATTFETRFRNWTPVCELADLEHRAPRSVHIEGATVMVYRDGANLYAMAGRCTHRGGPLHRGIIADGCVTCPWHKSSFSLEDGTVLRGPATAPQRVFDVRTQDGMVEIRAPRP